MAVAPDGYLKKPALRGVMAPEAVLTVLAALSGRGGRPLAETLAQEAQLGRLPTAADVVREERVQRLHLAVRARFPDDWPAILGEAGRETADSLMRRQQSQRAQAMLAGAPWPLAAWLLGRWARQHAWTFAGSGDFRIVTGLEYELAANPLVRGAPPATCHWHVGLFGRLFQRLVDPDLECREVACASEGAPACRFVFALR